MKRTALKRFTPLKRSRKGLLDESPRTRNPCGETVGLGTNSRSNGATVKVPRSTLKSKPETYAYRKIRELILERADYNCEVRIEGVCIGRALIVDHKLNRSQGRDDSPENLQAICVFCDEYLRNHPAFAYEHGYAKRKWSA